MIAEFKAFFTVFQQGKELANAAKWKKKQISVNNLVAFFSAILLIAGGFGYKIPIDEITLTQLSSGILAAFSIGNGILTCITSSKVGVKSRDN